MTAEHKRTGEDQHSDQPEAPHEHLPPESDHPGDTPESRIELEPLEEDRFSKLNHGDPLEHPPHVQDLDVCPNCGASLAGESTVVCLRCGFDLRTLRAIETEAVSGSADDVAVDSADEPDEPDEPVAPTGRLRVSLSWVIAGLAGALLIAGLLAGVQALFPDVAPVAVGEGEQARSVIPWSARWIGALQFIATTVVWFGCAIAALVLFARLAERPIGTLIAAAAHTLAIVTAMQLSRFWDVPVRSLEWTTETATAVLVFLGLSLALLNVSRRDVLTYALITSLMFICLFFGSRVITWAMA